MIVRTDIYVPLIYLVAAIPYAWLGLYAWRRRPAVAVTPFAWVMLGMSIWTFAYSLELFVPLLSTKLFFTQIEYIGIISVPVFMLFFAFEYSGNSHLLTTRVRFLLWLLPLLSLLLVWTNPIHHLVWDMDSIIQTSGLTLLSVRFGPFFWIQTLFSYGLLVIASIMLIMELVQRPGIYRVQISFVVLSILIPSLGSLIFLTGSGPLRYLDLTPLFFLPTALGLFWAILKYRLLEVLPPEHISMLKNMKDGVVVLNAHQRILYINPTAERLFDRREEEVIGQPLSQVAAAFYKEAMPFLTGGEHRVEIPVWDGEQAKVFEMTVSPVQSQASPQTQGQVDSMIIMHDVTERKEAEVALSRRESFMSSINLAAEQFLRESNWANNIPVVLENIGQAADVSRVFVVMNYTDANKSVYSSLCYEWAAPGIAPQINNPALKHVPLIRAGFGRWKELLSQGMPINGLVRNFPEQEHGFFDPLGSLSVAAFPIFVGSKWWGFIMFDECREERLWTVTELDAFHAAANIFGAAESRTHAEQQVIRRQRALGLLHEIVRVSLQADDIKEMAQTVVDRLGELIAADGCFITVWDDENNLTIPVAAYGAPKEEYPAYKPQPGERTFTEAALQAGKTLVVDDTNDTTYADQHIVQHFPSRSILVLPLIANRKKLGAVLLAFNKLHHFQKDEIAISEQASALIALALEKFQAVEEAKRRADTSEILRKASLAIAEKLEMEQAVSHILEQLNRVIPYDSASVQLLEGNDLVIVGGHGWDNPEEILGLRFPVKGDNPNHMVMETGKPFYLPEAREAYKKFNEPPHNHIRSWLGVPLIAQDKTIGLLAIDSTESNHFKEEDIQTATEFANQVAFALENARLYKETQNQALTDALTGIYNRRGLFQLGEFEFQRARRINRPFSVMMFDIDHFKRVNDKHGHAIGDQVLHQLAIRCQNHSRATDLIGRYGGEEFVILLPETNLNAAHLIAERMRQSILYPPFLTDAGALQITVSVGITEAKDGDSIETLIERADSALYKAKRKGRNCVAASGPD